jgi:hypothetical protein
MTKRQKVRVAVVALGIISMVILLWAEWNSLSLFERTDLSRYQAYLYRPVVFASVLALVLCAVGFGLTWLPLTPLVSSIIPLALMVGVIAVIGTAFVVKYDRAAPVRFAQQVVTSLRAPAQFGRKSLVTEPGDFDHPEEQWLTSLTASEACRQLPDVIAAWVNDPTYRQTLPTLGRNGTCDFTATVRGLPMDVNVFVNDIICRTINQTGPPTCTKTGPSNAYVFVTLTADTRY